MSATLDRKTEAAPLCGVFAAVYRNIVNDRGLLPSMPDIALRIRAAMNNPSYNVSSVARVVQTDSAVSAHLIRMANSALYRTEVPITDLRRAIARLGVPVCRNIVTAYTMRAMFVTDSKALTNLMRERWRESALTSAVASVLASHCRGFSADRAMLAGLLQDIGSLPLIRAMESRIKPGDDLGRLEATLRTYTPKTGVVLLQHWGFDDDIIETARAGNNWHREIGDKPDLADVVTIARLHANVGTPRMHDCPRINEVPAYRRLELGELGPRDSLAILDCAQKEVSEVLSSLGV
ncbi:MAG: HDOD domain-containing protein [Pseudomonadota bacterium]